MHNGLVMKKILIPDIPEEEQTEVVKLLLNIISQQSEMIQKQAEEIQTLKDEIARLKGKPPKPKISPSTMDSALPKKKRSRKERQKREPKQLKITETIHLKVDSVPDNSRFKGYRDFIVQDIRLEPYNVNYKREKWRTPDGKYITAQLPDNIDDHFGPNLKTLILYLNYSLNVTQPLLHEFLDLMGVKISSGTVNDILTEDKEDFHHEKEEILKTGLHLSDFVVVDDTGARHSGKNGYCTHIGNDVFAYYKSSQRKNRINFLEILRGTHTDYVINMGSLAYMKENEFPESLLERLENVSKKGRILGDKDKWNDFLKMMGIRKENHIKTATEAALVASILSHDFNEKLVIVSDEAGQFDVFLHALCWIHAERKIKNIIPVNDYQKTVLDSLLEKLWKIYRDIQLYQKRPDPEQKETLKCQFDELCSSRTNFDVINDALSLLYKNKGALLLALEYHAIPLNNNISENDIRAMVQKRKVHGGTRGANGRLARDTFMSLKKTSQKLEISFYEYLYDRVANINNIPMLNHIIKNKLVLCS